MRGKLLIIDDDDALRSQLQWALADEYDLFLTADRPSALNVLQADKPEVVLLDLGLPPAPDETSQGLALLKELLRLDSSLKIIIFTGNADIDSARRAIDEGAADYLSKPVVIDELKTILKRAFFLAGLQREHQQLEVRVAAHEEFESMVGASPQIAQVFHAIRKVALSDAPVLILGESGTGKEMAARAIHRQSERRAAPFVAINCGAIPETLLESELFGHEKGAFTGAHAQNLGKIQAAEGGTLFLDEIGELPLALQVKFLRLLQDHAIQRIGGRQDIHVNIRVIAATNSDLNRALAEGRFREDLYYRLAVVTLHIPPVRERQDDIPILAQSFLQKFAADLGSKKFTPGALRSLRQYHWPGNVREMENRIRRAVIMAEGRNISETDLELTPSQVPLAGHTLKEAREEIDRQMVQRALERHRHNISQAALELGVSRPTLYDLLGKFGLKKFTSSNPSNPEK